MKQRNGRLTFLAGAAAGALLTLLFSFGFGAWEKEPSPTGPDAAVSTEDSGQAALPAPDKDAAAGKPDPDKDTEDGKPAPEDITTDLAVGKTERTAHTAGQSGEAAEDSRETGKSAKTYVLWDADAVYNGGDEVYFGNGVYRARWWTQKEEPARTADGVWEYLGELPQEDPAGAEAGKEKRSETAAAAGVENRPGTEGEPENRPGTEGKPGNRRRTDHKESGLKLVAYYPAWEEGEEKLSKLRFNCITHVNYAFAIPTPEGGLRPLEHAEQAKEIIRRAHEEGAKALLAVGGWSYQEVPLEPVFVEATETKEKRERLAGEILELCDSYGFDGVDMDWEHPRADGASKAQYEAFMLYLAEKLHEKDKLLTAAVLPGVTADGLVYYDAAAHTDAVLQAVDWINVMAYDGGDGERHSTYDYAVACSAYWKDDRKLPGDKIVLGVPFYARPSWADYQELLDADPEAWNKDVSFYNGMEAWYNGFETVRRKAAFAKEELGGIMIWEITQDTADPEKSLLSAAREGLGL